MIVDRSVTVFAKNEENSVRPCLTALAHASERTNFHITVLVNGSTDRTLAQAISHPVVRDGLATVFAIRHADKSNAWNQFIYKLRPRAKIYIFVDGYTAVEESALLKLEKALAHDESINAVTGLPSKGRSAPMLARQANLSSGLHGSLFALAPRFIEAICQRNLRLPIGLYRGDGLIGSMAAHNLNPRTSPWNTKLIRVVPEATWFQTTLSVYRPSHLMRQFNRMIRQARGQMENQAIKSIIYRDGYEGLPQFADQMIINWLSSISLAEQLKCYAHPLRQLAIQQVRRARLITTDELSARIES